ncbi:NUDIX hydrolase [Actinokineospora fastidiosa]|uniref:NUDIX hydrolase n=1 Tax=Actinokineospora fastidiosa TaxID=1816 RepID=A0A918LIE2_9PSEU|nr:NUDIX hydrolase [Actinokineospora fastidiosa]GGS52010.1 NUDIX hydrolase [Actinokineospora fastidiosa]
MAIAAAGAVLWRPAPGGVEVAVAHRPRYDDWSLPKGKLDPGETIHRAAVREVFEETGHRAVLGRHLGQVAYRVGRSDKTVDYFAARAVSGSFVSNEEVDELVWLPIPDAAGLLTYHHDRDVLAAFAVAPLATTLLLVRHAHAGDRSEWDGPDELRPLSAKGHAQVAALMEFLPLFGPTRVHSVPNVRCEDTVRPLAERLGCPVTPEKGLGEAGYQAAPEAAHSRLLTIAAGPGTAVVCSQGGVIPSLLDALGAESGVEGHRARKGSVWVLSLDGDKLVGADYVARP